MKYLLLCALLACSHTRSPVAQPSDTTAVADSDRDDRDHDRGKQHQHPHQDAAPR